MHDSRFDPLPPAMRVPYLCMVALCILFFVASYFAH